MRAPIRALVALVIVVLATTTACSSSGDNSSTGTAGKKPVGSFSTLTGTSTTVVFATGFLKALTTLGLTPTVFGTAKITKQHRRPVAVFPITGGHATIYRKGEVTPYVQGEIDHEGSGLTLSAGKTRVTISNFVIHPGNNSRLTGDLAVDGGVPLHGITLFDLDGSTLRTPTISKAGVARLFGTRIYLSTDAADALDGVFKTSALAGDRKVGVGIAVIEATGK